MRSKSARAHTRAWRGKREVKVLIRPPVRQGGRGLAGVSQTNASRAQRAGARILRLGAKTLAALGAAAGEDLAAIGGRHAGTETVVALALEVAGLVGALGGHGSARRKRRKRPRILAAGRG